MRASHRHRAYGAAAVVIFAVLAVPAFAATHSPVGVQVLENGDRVVLAYRFGDYRSQTVAINGTEFQELLLEHEAMMLQTGAPALPVVGRSIIIPDNAEMGVRVMSANFYEVPANIAPSKGNLPRTVNPDDVPYTFGPVYNTDAFFPGDVATAGQPYIMRDWRGLDIQVYPFQHNPVTGTLRVYVDITVEVHPVGPGQTNVLDPRRRDNPLAQAFDELYQGHFLNYVPDRYPPVNETGGMLIIVNDAWNANVQPLAAHKNSIGIPTTVVNVGTIGNNATAIKSYIQGVYNQGNLAFVLLVGDAAQVATPTASGGSSDPTYSKLAGDDDYPEIIVGRFSAETPAHVDTQVQRSIEYELLPAVQQTWFWKGTGIASAQGAGIGDDGEADYEHIGLIRTQLLAAGYTQVDEIYDTNGGTKQMVTNALNEGRGIINYCGHGSDTSWITTGFSNSDVNALVNDNKLPFILSVACVNGNFAPGTCFAEAWLRATHNGEPTGAVGAYMSSINQSWAPPMETEDEFAILYLDPAQPYRSYGALCFAGSNSMMQKYGADGVEMFDTWHIFGDPSLRIVGTVGPPHGLSVTPRSGFEAAGQQGGPFTPNSITYTLTNQNATPLQYQGTKTQQWVTLTNVSGTLPGGATASVTVALNSHVNILPNGQYSDTVTFTNLTDHDGDTTRTVTLKVGVPTPQYDYPLDTNPGWNISGGQWAFGHPTGQGGASFGNPDPSNGYTGTNVYGVNLNGDYSTTPGGPYYLTLGPVSLANLTQVSLKFQRWLNSDYQPFVTDTIQVSNNGSTWNSVWSNGSGEIAESAWSLQEYDLSTYADNQPAVYIRWGYEVGSYAWAYSGWNIDDVQIWGLGAGGTIYPIGDMNCDGATNAFDIDPFVLALTDPAGYQASYPGCNRYLGDVNCDYAVDAFDIDGFVECLTTGCPACQ